MCYYGEKFGRFTNETQMVEDEEWNKPHYLAELLFFSYLTLTWIQFIELVEPEELKNRERAEAGSHELQVGTESCHV